jgi:hypothetical protein
MGDLNLTNEETKQHKNNHVFLYHNMDFKIQK